MNKTEGKNLRVVFYEGPGSAPLAAQDRYQAISSLLQNGFEVSRPVQGGSVAPADGAPMLMLGLFDGGRPPAFDGAGEVHARDLHGLAPEAVLVAARDVREKSGARKLEAWKPWFPVIDYDRCTNCMQCLTFCLFEVYGVDRNDKITVQTQSNCKTDCPACSRVCPEVAILFPKYKKGPINGDIVKADDVKREAMKIDISALLGGDLYASLRDRQQDARKRFSTERDESRALLERKRCLKELGKTLDIPDEVLMSLPSVGDIQERAERAKAKMASRQARSQTVKDTKPAPTEREWGI
ncbi:MAG TPA: ferredoxin family protein [Planctomycetota bacterium]|nr:ferredoxin family protein [Planctomycetota bacterium]